MRSFVIREIYEGQKPKFGLGFWWRAILLNIISLPFRPLAWFSKGYTLIDNSDWEFMYDDMTLKIERKQVAANGFEDCIPFYQLSSTNKNLNDLIRFKIFGSFICKTNNGLLLRHFKSLKNWTNSKLIYIDLNDYRIENICCINSAFPEWIGYKINDDEQIDITVEKTKDYKRIVRLTTNKKKTGANSAQPNSWAKS
jgi:hypothetical protein